jgi:hypothetical protein
MRTISAPETPLVTFCRSRKWHEVLERLASHPAEATPTEAALRGEATTVLACALRLGAPYAVIEGLVGANRQQLVVCHRRAGSVLHEALRYMASDEIVSWVLEQTLEEQASKQRAHQSKGPQHHAAQFQCVHVQESSRVILAPNLMQVQDDLGRTVLHHIVEQVRRRRINLSRRPMSTFQIFRQLLEAHPGLVHTVDADGNSPLVLLLSQHSDTLEEELEEEIYAMVQYLVRHFPEVVAHSRRMPRPWRFLGMSLPASQQRELPVSSPLYYALLCRRTQNTIQALLRAHEEIGMNGCTSVVTQHGEMCLHVAVTMRAPQAVLDMISRADPTAVQALDIYNLTPIDWLWMTHVIDWHNVSNRRLSQRRFLGRDYLDWHEFVTTRIPYQADRYDPQSADMVHQMQRDFLARLKVILTALFDNDEDTGDGLLPWVCQLPNIPYGVLKLVLEMDPMAHEDIRRRDTVGRYPLHHASARARGYRVSLPLGVTRGMKTLKEDRKSLHVEDMVKLFPAACRSLDDGGQLPLHIAIDAAKRDRLSTEAICDDVYANAVLESFFDEYPEAISQRDGKTMLLPWQQAAEGNGAQLDTIFQLLRREPALLLA